MIITKSIVIIITIINFINNRKSQCYNLIKYS